jgi:hypothetical protein
VALFNLGDAPLLVNRPYDSMGMPKVPLSVRNLWTKVIFYPATTPGTGSRFDPQSDPQSKNFDVTVPAHGCVLFEVRG